MLAVLAAWIISGGCTNYVSQAWSIREIIFPADLHFDAGLTIFKSLGVVRPGDTVASVFRIANSDTLTYTVETIVPSCHCISADPSGKIISPGSELILTLTFIADSITGSFDRQVDVFYKERESPDRISIYGYINNKIINNKTA